ncbi:MAG: hypothetical protein JOY90_23225 [Bradyrhizobium sp.]|uniref:hypothetical protein n=1 Tax=Bradyrhizobium sp. TaxID=376 RepID=UPI001D7FA2EB|nr:hypothetical protein [Bradyrhizobium sp.]MBV9563330.1 hypothetical protein [Bradyrhizobium sp.]
MKAVGSHADLFAESCDVADAAALKIVATQLKTQALDLERLTRIYKALGADTFALALEHLADAIPRALVRRIDPHHAQAPADSAAWTRSHLIALASGAAKPEPRPHKAEKTASVKKRKKPKASGDDIAEGFWATSVVAKSPRASKTQRK